MADRSVVYRLIADASRFKSGMNDAARSSDQTAASLDKTSKSTGKVSEGMDLMGISASTAAAAIGTKVIMSAANFEQAMSSIQAATRASAGDMALMEQAALDAGASTAFSATEAAAGIENLAKAGVSTADILNGGLSGALDLAAAGQLEVGQAAEIAATAMTQFNLAGSDVDRVADALAAGAGKAQGEVVDLGQALGQSGLVAGQMGLTLEETTGTLAAFASAGLLGSDAGTSLKTMLLRLANPSNEAAKAMEQFGISAYDANGNMVNTATLAGQLQAGFEGQSQATRDAAMATIFGSDAIRAANVLYSEGEEGVSNWTSEVSESGYAAETAAIQMDNLKGRFEELMGALETAQIGQGDGALGPLSAVLSGATQGINAFNGLNDATDGWITTLASGPVTQFPRMFDDLKTAMEGPVNEGTAFNDFLNNATGGLMSASAASGTLEGGSKALAGAVAQTAEQLKAQEDALQDAREAASKTAGSFFNLGDSLSDATVSLGDWIRQMANQADALNNFTANAQKAANKGLREGLIAALKEAGPEGALRMKQLANATESEIARANGAWDKGQQAINKYVDATADVPANKSTKLTLDDQGAAQKLAAYKNSLEALRDRNLTITTVYRVVGNATDALPARASGGPIYGPGTPTSDSIPAMLSTGEYVIKAAAVDHYGLGFFDQANAMRLADGGSTDKKKPRKKGFDNEGRGEATISAQAMKNLVRATDLQMIAAGDQALAAKQAAYAAEQQVKAAEDNLTAAENQLTATQQLRDSLASSVASQFSGSLTGGGLSGLMSTLSTDINAGSSMDATLRALIGSGLDTTGASAGLFQELAASNDLTTANQLLAAGPAMIAQLEQQYAQREAINQARGNFAANASYSAMLAQQTAAVATAEAAAVQANANAAGVQARLDQTNARIEALIGAVANVAPGVGAVLNNGAASAARGGRVGF